MSVVRINPGCIKRVNFREEFMMRFLTGQTKLSVLETFLTTLFQLLEFVTSAEQRNLLL